MHLGRKWLIECLFALEYFLGLPYNGNRLGVRCGPAKRHLNQLSPFPVCNSLETILGSQGERGSNVVERDYGLSTARYTGRRIRELRHRFGWTAEDFAEKLGLSATQVLRMESGHMGITLQRLSLVARTLGVWIRDLLPAPPEEPSMDQLALVFRGAGYSQDETQRILDYVEMVALLRKRRAEEDPLRGQDRDFLTPLDSDQL